MKLLIALTLIASVYAQQGVQMKWNGGNTNFNDRRNWNSNAVPGFGDERATDPSVISFRKNKRNGAAEFVPVSSLVTTGTYGFGSLELPVHGQLSFDENTKFVLNSDATGDSHFFTAAQDPNDERYDFSCHKNWENSRNNRPPCQNDNVLFDADNSYAVTVAGRHHVGGLEFSGVSVSSNEEISLMPQHQIYIGNGGADLRVQDSNTCDSDGFIMYTASGGSFQRTADCQCYSTCSDEQETLTDSQAIRHAFRQKADDYLDASEEEYTVSFALTIDAVDMGVPLDVAAYVSENSDVFENAFLESFRATGSANFTIIGDRYRFLGMMSAPASALMGVNGDGDIWAFDFGDSMSLFLSGDDIVANPEEMTVVYHLKTALRAAGEIACSDAEADITSCGDMPSEHPRRYEINWDNGNEIMIGEHLPNMDVLRAIDEHNLPDLAAALSEGLTNYLGIVRVDGIRFRVNSDHRLGAARSALYMSFSYWSYPAPMGSGAAPSGSAVHDALTERADAILISYQIQSHHQCFNINSGFDDACVSAAVVSAYEEARANGASEADAQAAARDALISIRGCGLDGDCDISDEELATIEQDASATVSASASASTNSEAGSSMALIGAAAAVVVIVIIVVMNKKGSGGGSQKAQRDAIAFENPVYENSNKAGASEGLYDEPAFGKSQQSNPMYDSNEDLSGGADEGGYLDVDPEDEEEEEDE